VTGDDNEDQRREVRVGWCIQVGDEDQDMKCGMLRLGEGDFHDEVLRTEDDEPDVEAEDEVEVNFDGNTPREDQGNKESDLGEAHAHERLKTVHMNLTAVQNIVDHITVAME